MRSLLNANVITIIPKTENVECLSDFRPISRCNASTKNWGQCSFAHELVHNYHRNNVKKDCALKIDLRKAYDSIHWDCIEEILIGLRFPEVFIKWVMTCVGSPFYSVMVNGNPEGCKDLKIKHISFADDLFVFCKGNLRSVKQIADVLKPFNDVSGLQVNNQKSCIYFCGVDNDVKENILNELSFKEGSLPVKYLGVPLIGKRLSKGDCQGLIEKFTKRISHWTVRHLTYAGWLQLINDVLFSMQVYWCSLFILPIAVIRGVERMCKNFLWKGAVDIKYVNLVAWKSVCMKKEEGGLGIKDLVLWNKVDVVRHI
ncbi:uncharacterized protein LOC126681507 [Mercurialis annua]|uniref:uncharacterized protein LOC126681507 n=1 Tax=Mercurialis annua TaxID=3986 RepID=UPI00215E86E2|nr:uncharacterized protein LOC126681507 [Mercurialis annua]